MGFFELLAILFIALKMLHFIDWSWWLVTFPLWGGAVVVIFLTILAKL